MPKDKGKKKNPFTVKDYVADLDGSSMTGNWTPKGTWHRIHGDGKSTTGGQFHMETMHDSAGNYKVKIVGGDKSLVENLEYKEEPSFDTIVADLKAAYGMG